MPKSQTLAKIIVGTALGVAVATRSAHSAALEQVVPSTIRLLFQEGRYGEIGATYTDPDQSGHDANIALILQSPTPVPVSGDTGDVFDGYWTVNAAYKADITERLSYAIVFDQPYGARTSYGAGTFPADVFTYDGTYFDLETYQLTGVLAYDVTPNVKVYGGPRAQRLDTDAAIPSIGPTVPPPFGPLPGYSVDADPDWGYGYLVGAAYHRPEIALRVALTYQSKIAYSLDTQEIGGIVIPGVQDGDTVTDVDTPQSVTLEFQTGIAPETLVFGSVRWVDWSEMTIAPPTYNVLIGSPLIDYEEDWWTYNLGIARQFTDQLAGSVSLTYEPSVDEVLSELVPYDGRTTVSAALSYDYGPANITGGVTYGALGDTSNIIETAFDDGSVWGLGLRVGYSF